MTAPQDCPWCHHAMRRVDLLREGDQLALEHNPVWRGRECPGPSFGAAVREAPAPTDYAAGQRAGWREAIAVVRTALNAARAEPRIVVHGAGREMTDRRGRLVALGALLDQMIEAAPR